MRVLEISNDNWFSVVTVVTSKGLIVEITIIL